MEYPIKWYHEVNATNGVFRVGAKPYGVDMSFTRRICREGVAEVRTYIGQLIRKYGPPPPKTEFIVLQILCDWGDYYDAGLQCTGEITFKMDKYIQKLERGLKNWDDESLAELKRLNHPYYK